MKKKIMAHGIVILIFVFMPLLACLEKNEAQAQTENSFYIYDISSEEIYSVEPKDFLIGAIATEMPVSFEREALKAQGIAAYTYYRKLMEDNGGEAISADPTQFYIYTTKEQMQQRWGDSFEEYYGLLSDIADEIYGKALVSDGQLITASYYAISSGNTETSASIWGGDRTYLQAVASPWDAFAPGYYSEASFTLDEARAILYTLVGDTVFAGDLFGETERTASGSVVNIQVGDQTVSGGEIRDAFGLRSQNFTWEVSDDHIVFQVKGWGHGVGMSQTGADYLARQGFSCEEILAYYYPGTEIRNVL